ncbi:hypothetical protein SK128_021722 [Halocaridina rubra]|uniref:Uncharacterized protein n=1 Tax=Halocaridina rubra TaxID=373956 RepID=A0AAN8X205_HALRR
MTVNEESVQPKSAISNEDLFRAKSPQGLEKSEAASSNGFIDDLDSMSSSISSSTKASTTPPILSHSNPPSFSHPSHKKVLKPPRSPPPLPPSTNTTSSSDISPLPPPALVVTDAIGSSSAISTVGSLEDDIEHSNHSLSSSSNQRSFHSIASMEDDFGYFNDTLKFLPPAPLRPKNENRFQSLS